MRKLLTHLLSAALICLVDFAAVSAGEKTDDEGFSTIFDGKTLENWDGNPLFWSVKDGAITGQTTPDNPTRGNTFIIWRGGEIADFELKLEYKIIDGNSGIQYRSFEVPDSKWVIGGYQGDFEAGDTYSGILYGERFRSILARRGQKTELVREDGKFKVNVIEQFGDSDEIQKKIKKEDWNEYHITAKGFHFIHRINGVKTAEVTDSDEEQRRKSGLLALQLHQGPPMTVQFRNIRLKRLNDENTEGDENTQSLKIELPETGTVVIGEKNYSTQEFTAELKKYRALKQVQIAADAQVPVAFVQEVMQVLQKAGVTRFTLRTLSAETSVKVRKIVFIAGTKSHGYGAHEHRAGCMLLAKALDESGLPVKTELVTDGWPKDPGVLDDADAIVIYADGGGRHPFHQHIDEIDRLMDKGVGLVCIHYAVEIPKGKSGDAFLDWTGGYFEAHWSVNPHWTAEYDKLPDHPVSRGVKSFRVQDEWYYHMRFREEMAGVTPILTDLPPESTLTRPDGAHSGNPSVRAAVAAGQPQHTAWVRERENGGRGFGFTGGHFHWNWGHNQFRKLVLNAIVWTAQVEVPETGVPSKPLTVKDLTANQDFPQPDNFNPARIQAMLEEWNRDDS